jgi:hypothetical protein
MRSNSSQGNLTVPERGTPPQKRICSDRDPVRSQQDFLHYLAVNSAPHSWHFQTILWSPNCFYNIRDHVSKAETYSRGRTFFPCEEIVLIVPLATLKALPLGTMLARFTVPREYVSALLMFTF